ncbi:Uncharacterised protein [Chlamydia trachomatis]|uniref:Uncharacterized protein n=1 Tax=Peribacillus simplex TaxID=1478 RepID=A0AAN2PBQ8_9BACI|nr:hypothetical protein CQ056_22490 [Peribacillus simplex]CEG24907.1 hypothetical protein BN1180_05750 [Peribacillus simplex]CRH68034.1 Uncharacterised protein [Chlamydia trachomatis]CRH88330.1 Uncharacterised protein [Chlamydia trachomatis]CRI74368.1 Uncharacterised protein [Chlamydia trachomatis]
MLKKFPHLLDDLLILFGIIFAIGLIYTKEIYIHDPFGNPVNLIHLLILTTILVAINRSFRAKHEENDEEIKHK